MQLPSLANLSDENLFEAVKSLKGTENKLLADIILHLAEIDSRGIYREAGYSSLFSYCREGLGYSEGAAYRRIQAARCLKSSPEIYEGIQAGKLSLSALAEVSKVMTNANKDELLKRTEGASKKQAEVIKAEFGGPVKLRQERITAKVVALSPAKSEEEPKIEKLFGYSFHVRKEVHELYEEAAEIAGHCPIAEVIEKALRAYVQKHRPEKIRERKVEPKAKSFSRYISKSVRRAVFKRDSGQCTYASPNGKRCCERHGLQFDHIVPFASGGPSTVENLRLRCSAHNQLYAEKCFGREFMEQRRNKFGSDSFSVR